MLCGRGWEHFHLIYKTVVKFGADEVDDIMWVPWETLTHTVADGSADVSPWCYEQITELGALGADPSSWPVAGAETLPPAARQASSTR